MQRHPFFSFDLVRRKPVLTAFQLRNDVPLLDLKCDARIGSDSIDDRVEVPELRELVLALESESELAIDQDVLVPRRVVLATHAISVLAGTRATADGGFSGRYRHTSLAIR